ncbi:flotillin family protein [Minwuia sp.]|uniref:flotillin family protein n=1 Tax=Minwuia sp. TaxID=2493630 RepID=UPI003A9210FA
MGWLVAIIVAIIILVVGILFLNRFYKKGSREVALIRTGFGGQRIVMERGCIALPIIHRISEVNMKTIRLEIERKGERSIITNDRLRVDAAAEFYVRVNPSEEGVTTAAQALAGKSFRASELAETLDGKLVDALLSVAARYTMDELQDRRGEYVREVSEALAPTLAMNGLLLENVALTRLDQTPFGTLDENNAFNAVGMRRLSEIIATSKKERARIDSEADVAVRQSQLEATKRRFVIEQESELAQQEQQREIESRRAESQAEIAEQQALAERRREAARIERDKMVKQAEIDRDSMVRRLEVESEMNTQTARHEREVALAAKRIDEARAKAAALLEEAKKVEAEAGVETARVIAEAERQKGLALIRAKEEAEVDDTRVASETGTITAMAKAKAEATDISSTAKRIEMLAEAEGRRALVEAENGQSEHLMRLKLDMAKIAALPEVVSRMTKPAEKIDSIRINHISGFNGSSGGEGGSASGGGSGDGGAPINQVVDSVLAMALQLPAIRKLGEDIGMNVGDGLKGLTGTLDEDSPKKAEDN